MKFIRPKVILAATILVLVAVFQNCNKTSFTQAPEGTEDAASTETPADVEEPIAQLPATTIPTIPRTTLPAPITSPPTGIYSTCQSKTMTVACPDNKPNCTCTATLPAGSFAQDNTERSPGPDRTKNGTGPSCKIQIPDGSENSAHSGTVVSPEYGTCTNYCSVTAKCINGQWQQFGATW